MSFLFPIMEFRFDSQWDNKKKRNKLKFVLIVLSPPGQYSQCLLPSLFASALTQPLVKFFQVKFKFLLRKLTLFNPSGFMTGPGRDSTNGNLSTYSFTYPHSPYLSPHVASGFWVFGGSHFHLHSLVTYKSLITP